MLVPPTYTGLAPFGHESSSVLLQETNVKRAKALAEANERIQITVDANFRHGGWHRDRLRVSDALCSAQVGVDRILAFDACGDAARIVRDADDATHYAIRANYCRDRFCQPCARARGQVISANINDLAPAGTLRFITLTLRESNTILEETIDSIYKAFRKLRATKFWKSCVYGGAAFLETKFNEENHRWHTHIHAIVEGDYFPVAKLKELWCAATGGSTIVHITRIRNKQMTLSYVLKYCGKGIDNSTIRQPERLVQAIIALQGRRLVLTFGKWRRLKTLPPKGTTTWVDVAPLWSTLIAARKGETDAIYLCERLRINIKDFDPEQDRDTDP